ncbi:hypothetical protein D3C75_726700 [compost metagenome]
MVHAGEALQRFNLLSVGLVIGRGVAEEVLNFLAGQRWGATNGRVGVQVAIDEPDFDSVTQLLNTLDYSIQCIRVTP